MRCKIGLEYHHTVWHKDRHNTHAHTRCTANKRQTSDRCTYIILYQKAHSFIHWLDSVAYSSSTVCACEFGFVFVCCGWKGEKRNKKKTYHVFVYNILDINFADAETKKLDIAMRMSGEFWLVMSCHDMPYQFIRYGQYDKERMGVCLFVSKLKKLALIFPQCNLFGSVFSLSSIIPQNTMPTADCLF